jgi:CYTH domain-containing protein/predicted ATPase
VGREDFAPFACQFMEEIKKIVLTGGPCAGKTTALVKIMEHFSSLGFKVFTIPEVPTLFSQGGVDYLTDNKTFFYEEEQATLETQIGLEDKFSKMAEAYGKPSVIVCDRGTLDISTYLPPEMWKKITRACGTDTESLRNRYDAVLHLVSAANGAEKYYTTANNKQRKEGLQLARQLDKKIINAWMGHPHLRVINNHDNFENKLRRVIKEISDVLALPQPIEKERRYVVEVKAPIPECIESEIIQTYLTAEPGCEMRLRRRVWKGKKVNILTTKKKVADDERIETERTLTNNLYASLLRQADPYRQTIKKIRKTFIWKGQFFELDHFLEPINHLITLEVKGVAEKEDVHFPPAVKVIKDITGDMAYDNYNIALRK